MAKPKSTLQVAKNVKLKWQNFFTPLDDRLVIERFVMSNVTGGGIIIPDSVTKESLNKGKVLAIGRGHQSEKGNLLPMDVKVGDEIIFSNFAGPEMDLNHQKVIILREHEVLGIIK